MKTKIVIAGGGFAGLYAAMRLDKTVARRPDVEVLLISDQNFLLFTPMLHEVAAGDLYPGDIVNPFRRVLRHVTVAEAEVEAIDLNTRKVHCVAGVKNVKREFAFDHLLLALGSETNFFNMAGVRDWAVGMKSLADAAQLRNRMVALLEWASLENDEAARRRLLTFVTVGGGFAGVETTGAVNDFVRETARYYPQLREDMIRIVIVHPGDFLLPELGEELGRYAEVKLRQRKVEVIKGLRVTDYDGQTVTLNDGTSFPTSTLIWTAGVTPSAVLASLPFAKEHGRIRVDEHMAVPGTSGIWAAGDCAAVPDLQTGKFQPTTAQHGTREGVVVAKNIERAILGQPLEPFRFRTMGLLASIGHRTGVAMVFGIKFSGLLAWWFWRTVYLGKLPGLAKKMRVLAAWALDLFFGREIEQIITPREVEELSEKLARMQKQASSSAASAD